jgi:hypothetical protein
VLLEVQVLPVVLVLQEQLVVLAVLGYRATQEQQDNKADTPQTRQLLGLPGGKATQELLGQVVPLVQVEVLVLLVYLGLVEALVQAVLLQLAVLAVLAEQVAWVEGSFAS